MCLSSPGCQVTDPRACEDPPACVTLSAAALNNEQTWVSPASRVGLLNGRKHSHQYLLCKQGSRGVDRPGAWVAQRRTQSQRTYTNTLECCYSLLPLSPLFPLNAITTQADRQGPRTVVFDLIASSAKEQALTTAQLLVDTAINLQFQCNSVMQQQKCPGSELIFLE